MIIGTTKKLAATRSGIPPPDTDVNTNVSAMPTLKSRGIPAQAHPQDGKA
jgi:hypothetical protein